MNYNTNQNDRIRASLGLMAGTLLLFSPTAAFSMDPCEELRRDCMDYCRYQNPMLDHRDCKRECRDRVRNCRGGGMTGPMGYPGARGRSERSEPDFRGMPEAGAYRGGGYGYGAPPVPVLPARRRRLQRHPSLLFRSKNKPRPPPHRRPSHRLNRLRPRHPATATRLPVPTAAIRLLRTEHTVTPDTEGPTRNPGPRPPGIDFRRGWAQGGVHCLTEKLTRHGDPWI